MREPALPMGVQVHWGDVWVLLVLLSGPCCCLHPLPLAAFELAGWPSLLPSGRCLPSIPCADREQEGLVVLSVMWACAMCGSLVVDTGRRRHEYVCVCARAGGGG